MKKLSTSALILPLVATGCGSVEMQNVEDNRPNIILFVADDHGLDALGCYGNPIIKTPNLDALADDGVRFSNAFCTSASSAASRSVLLTGQYGHAIGAYGHTHDYHHFSTYESVKSLPVLLEESGYTTARIGKYHVAPESVYHFQTTYKADPRNTVEMAEASKGIFDSETPFFLYFCTDDPHRSADRKDWRLPNRFGNKDEGYEGVETIKYDPKDVLVPSFLPDTKESREEIAQYYESISRIDQGFGLMMRNLEASGKRDNTIVIYISDNGMAFPGAKTTLYDAGMNLPCIISDPRTDSNKGGTCDAMLTWADMTPTLLDMAGVEYEEEDFHGRTFSSAISKPTGSGRNEVFAAHNFHEITMYYPMRVLRDRHYKLIWNVAWQQEYPFASDLWVSSTWQRSYRDNAELYGERKMSDFLQRPRFELYDIENDPNESHNLAAEKPELLESMKVRLLDYMKRTSDPWVICWGDHDTSLQGSGVNL
ncbi:MAG: sulfatase [Rikenellaceae bacterium]